MNPRGLQLSRVPDPERRLMLAAACGIGLASALPTELRAQSVKAVGFRGAELQYSSGRESRVRRLLLWYPAAGGDARYDYDGQIGRAAPGAAAAPGLHPLLVFSHGYLGAADQSIFITENLARMGYIVAAVDHADAQGRAGIGGVAAFARPQDWVDETYLDRRDDLSAVVDHIATWHTDPGSFLHGHVELSAIGAVGHSLGGYAVLGLAGARRAWRDMRVRAVLGFSPYVAPYLHSAAEGTIDVPTMLQGGTFDIGITPDLPAFRARLRGARYLLVLRAENHLGWTNLASLGRDTLSTVAQGNPRWIVGYAAAFFDRHLRGLDRARVLERPNAALESFLYEPGPRR